MKKVFMVIFLSVLLVSCAEAGVKDYDVEIMAEYPHDTGSYTQGLFFHKGQMYETTGLHGKSTLRKVDIQTGKAVKKLDFDRKYFVEGSVVFNDNLYILTLVPTEEGLYIYEAVKDMQVANVELTSSWEKTLLQIEQYIIIYISLLFCIHSSF